MSDAGCDPKTLALEAGPTTFNVSNSGGSKNTEYEVLSGSRIEGEVENVTAGANRKFSLNLKPGEYGIKCGTGDVAGAALKVTGTTSTVVNNASAADVVNNYRQYVQQQADALVTGTKAFTDAVIAGDVAKAKSLYVPARMPYERIEPVAESFGDLDPAIDARADDTPIDKIGGFHRIENALWVSNSTAGMAPVATQLLADVTKLRDEVKTLNFDAPKIANGANELLGEVSKSKITGEEERYSRTDLDDFDGNVAGSKAAIAAVRPLLDKSDPALGPVIDQRFRDVETALKPYATANGYVPYTQLSQDDTKKLSQVIDALAEPVSQVAAKVTG